MYIKCTWNNGYAIKNYKICHVLIIQFKPLQDGNTCVTVQNITSNYIYKLHLHIHIDIKVNN